MKFAFPLFPESASTFARGSNWLLLGMIVISGLIALLVFTLMFYFGVKYRAASNANRQPDFVTVHHNLFEAAWTLIPFFVFIGLFAWSARDFYQMRNAPADAVDIHVVGKQWMWKFQHADGTRELADLHVPVGTPIRLVMVSEDVIHSFFVPDFRIKQDVLPGRYSYAWFQATRPGKYRIYCTQYCGTSHAQMTGFVHVLTAEQYQAWLATHLEPTTGVPLRGALAGAKLYTRYACDHCHNDGWGKRVAPRLEGVYGREVRLRTGQVVTADENYLRESILNPSVKIVEGYEDLMPSFAGRLNEDELLDLIAYLKSLGKTATQESP